MGRNGKPKIDETGKTHGEWYVESYAGRGRYNCICSCGSTTVLKGDNLRNERTRSCGKCKVTQIGDKFDEWEVIENVGKGYYKCKCSCGKIRNIWISTLTSGNSKSCGHLQKQAAIINNVGKTYGEWEILKFLGNDVGIARCKACGSEKHVFLDGLKRGDSNSCGCVRASSYEKELIDLFPGAIHNFKLANPFSGNQLEIDLFYQNKKIGIEFNGDYWHSSFYKNINYHENKTYVAESQGIELIHIFEHEWLTKRDIILTYLRNRLEISDTIYADECKVIELDLKTSKELEKINHLHGDINSSIQIALEKDEFIYGLMTFDKSKYDKNIQYELLRLVYSEEHIAGGTEKMLKYFINTYNPESIVIYCDRAKFTGKVYQRLGFKLTHHTKPNYKWVKHEYNTVKVLSRLESQKHRLLEVDYNMTEDIIMESKGYLKIYDCGVDKYIWKL